MFVKSFFFYIEFLDTISTNSNLMFLNDSYFNPLFNSFLLYNFIYFEDTKYNIYYMLNWSENYLTPLNFFYLLPTFINLGLSPTWIKFIYPEDIIFRVSPINNLDYIYRTIGYGIYCFLYTNHNYSYNLYLDSLFINDKLCLLEEFYDNITYDHRHVYKNFKVKILTCNNWEYYTLKFLFNEFFTFEGTFYFFSNFTTRLYYYIFLLCIFFFHVYLLIFLFYFFIKYFNILLFKKIINFFTFVIDYESCILAFYNLLLFPIKIRRYAELDIMYGYFVQRKNWLNVELKKRAQYLDFLYIRRYVKLYFVLLTRIVVFFIYFLLKLIKKTLNYTILVNILGLKFFFLFRYIIIYLKVFIKKKIYIYTIYKFYIFFDFLRRNWLFSINTQQNLWGGLITEFFEYIHIRVYSVLDQHNWDADNFDKKSIFFSIKNINFYSIKYNNNYFLGFIHYLYLYSIYSFFICFFLFLKKFIIWLNHIKIYNIILIFDFFFRNFKFIIFLNLLFFLVFNLNFVFDIYFVFIFFYIYIFLLFLKNIENIFIFSYIFKNLFWFIGLFYYLCFDLLKFFLKFNLRFFFYILFKIKFLIFFFILMYFDLPLVFFYETIFNLSYFLIESFIFISELYELFFCGTLHDTESCYFIHYEISSYLKNSHDQINKFISDFWYHFWVTYYYTNWSFLFNFSVFWDIYYNRDKELAFSTYDDFWIIWESLKVKEYIYFKFLSVLLYFIRPYYIYIIFFTDKNLYFYFFSKIWVYFVYIYFRIYFHFCWLYVYIIPTYFPFHCYWICFIFYIIDYSYLVFSFLLSFDIIMFYYSWSYFFFVDNFKFTLLLLLFIAEHIFCNTFIFLSLLFKDLTYLMFDIHLVFYRSLVDMYLSIGSNLKIIYYDFILLLKNVLRISSYEMYNKTSFSDSFVKYDFKSRTTFYNVKQVSWESVKKYYKERGWRYGWKGDFIKTYYTPQTMRNQILNNIMTTNYFTFLNNLVLSYYYFDTNFDFLYDQYLYIHIYLQYLHYKLFYEVGKPFYFLFYFLFLFLFRILLIKEKNKKVNLNLNYAWSNLRKNFSFKLLTNNTLFKEKLNIYRQGIGKKEITEYITDNFDIFLDNRLKRIKKKIRRKIKIRKLKIRKLKIILSLKKLCRYVIKQHFVYYKSKKVKKYFLDKNIFLNNKYFFFWKDIILDKNNSNYSIILQKKSEIVDLFLSIIWRKEKYASTVFRFDEFVSKKFNFFKNVDSKYFFNLYLEKLYNFSEDIDKYFFNYKNSDFLFYRNPLTTHFNDEKDRYKNSYSICYNNILPGDDFLFFWIGLFIYIFLFRFRISLIDSNYFTALAQFRLLKKAIFNENIFYTFDIYVYLLHLARFRVEDGFTQYDMIDDWKTEWYTFKANHSKDFDPLFNYKFKQVYSYHHFEKVFKECICSSNINLVYRFFNLIWIYMFLKFIKNINFNKIYLPIFDNNKNDFHFIISYLYNIFYDIFFTFDDLKIKNKKKIKNKYNVSDIQNYNIININNYCKNFIQKNSFK